MDGGVRQTNIMEEIKAQIKHSATQKRKRKHLEILQAEANNLGRINTESPATDVIDKTNTLIDSDPSPGHLGVAFTSGFSNDSSSVLQDYPMQNKTPIGQGEADKELHLLMIYLDYVFPYLFPHYRSSILAGGRGWILEVLHTNKAVYHSAVSLSTSFYAIVLNNGDRAHDECTMQMIHKFESQIELGLKELHKEVNYINTNAPGFDMKKGLVVMQSILQMIFFEVATSNKDNWKLHPCSHCSFLADSPRSKGVEQDTQQLVYPYPQMAASGVWVKATVDHKPSGTAILYSHDSIHRHFIECHLGQFATTCQLPCKYCLRILILSEEL